MVRYIWKMKDGKFLWKSPEFKKEDKIVLSDSDDLIFVNILERVGYYSENSVNVSYKVKLFYSDGKTVEGWTSDMLFPIEILGKHALFDGRFNA